MVQLAQKRRDPRVSAAFQVRILSPRGSVLAQGRAANISEHGLFVILYCNVHLPAQILLEMALPSAAAHPDRRHATRLVAYTARVVREQVLGNLIGVGLELMEKMR